MIKKYLFLVLFGALSIAACSNNGEKTDKNAKMDETEHATVVSDSKENGKTIHITKADFLSQVMDYETNPEEWVYKGDKPCLIDFYASWCGPCKTAAPILDELAKKYKDDIYIYKVNAEVERELSSVFGVRSYPSFLFCPSEGKPTMSNGIARTPEDTKQMFIQMIDEILLGKEAGKSL
jgi:thioredoxin 1